MVEIRRRTDIEARAIARAREAAAATLFEYLTAAEQSIIAGVTPGEIASWATKEAAAAAYLATTATTEQQTMLSIEASFTGETLTALATRIMERATAYKQLAPALAGVRRRYEGEIAAATTGFDAILSAAIADLQGFFA
jgi:acetylornithine/succinyldiaminopimelate/putrescine aminotransferase